MLKLMRSTKSSQAGEQECEIIFCTVHIIQTWMRRIYEKTVKDKMVMAMHRTTKIGCEQLVAEAVSLSSVPDVQRYIQRNYQKSHNNGLFGHANTPLFSYIHKIVEVDRKKQSESE